MPDQFRRWPGGPLLMIVVLEGVSAAGKTSWCRAHARRLTIWEPSPRLRRLAPKGKSRDVDLFWSEQHARRWEAARRLEARADLAVCDTDPVKLHYAWCQWRVGDGTREDFDRAAACTRAQFADGRLGLADLVIVMDPDLDTLRRQREEDRTRSRGGFERHVRLKESLRRWYMAVERLESGHVLWWAPGSLDEIPHRTRQVRSGAELFDRLLRSLQ